MSAAELWAALAPMRDTIVDVLPIVAILIGFQTLVLRRPLPNLPRVVIGLVFVVLGLGLFIEGLETALFPLGKLMAAQLTAPSFILSTASSAELAPRWQDYHWVYAFAFAIGFATTIAEPSLIAVAIKAQEVSAGSIGALGLRLSVAAGVAVGLTIGSFRIVTGTPLHYYIIAGYCVVLLQTAFAPRSIVALAYDSGGVTTSTVTVPLVAALGLGLSSNIPGRNPVLDGFGLIAFASLFPIMTVLGYAQIGALRHRPRSSSSEESAVD